jgi:hypothetical protein
MTYHPSLMTGEESFTGDANAREQKVGRTSKMLANPDCSRRIPYRSDCLIASRSGSLPNQR